MKPLRIPDQLLLGLSLSLCVRDLINGTLFQDYTEIKGIEAGTKYDNSVQFNDVIQRYREVYWEADPDLGEIIARKLQKAGKIKQSRLTPRERAGDPGHNIAHGHWRMCAPQIITSIELTTRFYRGNEIHSNRTRTQEQVVLGLTPLGLTPASERSLSANLSHGCVQRMDLRIGDTASLDLRHSCRTREWAAFPTIDINQRSLQAEPLIRQTTTSTAK